VFSLSADQRRWLFERAEHGAPREVCGVLGGYWSGNDATVTTLISVSNTAAEPRIRYELEPQAQLRAIESIEEQHDLIGFYHSHPCGPAEPSETDTKLATWPDVVYVIVSLEPTQTVTAWDWNGHEFSKKDVTII